MTPEAPDAPVAREETEAERLKRKWDVTLREETPAEALERPDRWRPVEIALREALGAAGAVAVGADDAILLTMAEQVVGAMRVAIGGGDLASLAARLEDVSGWQEGILARPGLIEAEMGEFAALSDRLEALVVLAEKQAEAEPPQSPAERRTIEGVARPFPPEVAIARTWRFTEAGAEGTVGWQEGEEVWDAVGDALGVLVAPPASAQREAGAGEAKPWRYGLVWSGDRETLGTDRIYSTPEEAQGAAEQLRRSYGFDLAPCTLYREAPRAAGGMLTREEASTLTSNYATQVRIANNFGDNYQSLETAHTALLSALTRPASVGTAWTEEEESSVAILIGGWWLQHAPVGAAVEFSAVRELVGRIRSALARLKRGEAPPVAPDGLLPVRFSAAEITEIEIACTCRWNTDTMGLEDGRALGAAIEKLKPLVGTAATVVVQGGAKAPAVGAEVVGYLRTYEDGTTDAFTLEDYRAERPADAGATDQPLGVIGPVSPGDPIAEVGCPCCGAALCVEHGDEPGEVVVIGVPVEEAEPEVPGVYSLRHLREAWLDGWETGGGVEPDPRRENDWYEFTRRAGIATGDAPAAEGGAS